MADELDDAIAAAQVANGGLLEQLAPRRALEAARLAERAAELKRQRDRFTQLSEQIQRAEVNAATARDEKDRLRQGLSNASLGWVRYWWPALVALSIVTVLLAAGLTQHLTRGLFLGGLCAALGWLAARLGARR